MKITTSITIITIAVIASYALPSFSMKRSQQQNKSRSIKRRKRYIDYQSTKKDEYPAQTSRVPKLTDFAAHFIAGNDTVLSNASDKLNKASLQHVANHYRILYSRQSYLNLVDSNEKWKKAQCKEEPEIPLSTYLSFNTDKKQTLKYHKLFYYSLPDSLSLMCKVNAIVKDDWDRIGKLLLSSNFDHIPSLRKLTIINSFLKDIPPMPHGNITKLNLQGNNITELTDFSNYATQLQKLKTLNLSCNKLKKLPGGFFNNFFTLTSLKSLNLKHNELIKLPNLPISLCKLYVDNNSSLTSLPPNIRWLTNLTELKLSEDQCELSMKILKNFGTDLPFKVIVCKKVKIKN